MDQPERFVSIGFVPGKVYPTGVNFTTSNSRNRALIALRAFKALVLQTKIMSGIGTISS